MLLTKYVDIKPSGKYFKILKDNNITFKNNEIVSLPISLLLDNSSIKVKVKCDVCGKENNITYQKYNKNFKKYNIYTCKKCFNIKNKKTNLKKHNSENYNNRIKSKTTCKTKYGVENVSQLEEIKMKKIETKLLLC